VPHAPHRSPLRVTRHNTAPLRVTAAGRQRSTTTRLVEDELVGVLAVAQHIEAQAALLVARAGRVGADRDEEVVDAVRLDLDLEIIDDGRSREL
jgi:hypothetical protein